MPKTKGLEKEFQEIAQRIERLKQAEKQFMALGAPPEVFGEQISSLRAKLRFPDRLEEVERDLQVLQHNVEEYRSSQEQKAEIGRQTQEVRKEVEIAAQAVEEAKRSGGEVSEAETLLAQARSNLERGSYQEAIAAAQRATQLARQAKETAMTAQRTEHEAQQAVQAAETIIRQTVEMGCAVSEAETLLQQARSALKEKNYSLASEYAGKSRHLCQDASEQSKPQMVFEMSEKNFQPNVWKAVDLNIANHGKSHAQDISITFSREVETKLLKSITRLNAGAQETLRIGFKPREEGDIPLEAEIAYRDAMGRDYKENKTLWLKVRAKLDEAEPTPEVITQFAELPQYTIMEKLGSGGFADVFRAQRKDGLIVALKRPRLDPFKTFVPTDFLKEAELWSKLSHPNIVKVYEYAAKPYPWIAMELMPGGSLRGKIGTISMEDSLQITIRVAQALVYAHHLGVIHRDMKPENVLFDAENNAKITDWGLGKVMLDASRSIDGFKGTLAYSAPEQLSSSKFGSVDWRTDIYQLGAMLYEMLTGGLFLGGELGRILEEEPTPPSKVTSAIPKAIDEILLRAVAKKKETRYQDASYLEEELKRALRILKGS